MAASVLLNFANGIDFMPTDPLIGMVRAGASLLAYDQLSVETFSRESNKQKEQILTKVSELRNILEARSLSSADKGERIRLIILLDFAPWLFLKPHGDEGTGFDAAYPSLKLDHVKNTVQSVFGSKNKLLPRFDYNVIFLDDTSDEARTRKYWQSAYQGYAKGAALNGWVSSSNVQLNQKRDEALNRMESPDASLLLSDPSVNPFFRAFQKELDETVSLIKNRLKQVGRERDFEAAVRALFEPETVDAFRRMDYNGRLLSAVQEVAGLGASRFRDCVCVFMNYRLSVKTQKTRDDIVLKSLLQLLCTMGDEDYKQQFRPLDDSDFHKLLLLAEPDEDEIRVDALEHYRQDIARLGAVLGGSDWNNPGGKLTGMNWDSTSDVTVNIYTPHNPEGQGAHASKNSEAKDLSRDREKQFRQQRRVPFFLGSGPGDWHWFQQVTRALNECLTLEDHSLGLLTESPTRAGDSEFIKKETTTNFGNLGTAISNFSIADVESKVDHDRYLLERKQQVEKLRQMSEQMRTALVKLGFRSRMLWIAFLGSIFFTICYAFHFIYEGRPENLYLVAAGFLAILLLFGCSMVIAHGIISGKIQSVYQEIDTVLDAIRKLDQEHLESVNKLVTDMSTVDAQRKTLSEMKEKYGEWKIHNKKVQQWVNYVRNLELILSNYLMNLGVKELHAGGAQGNSVLRLDDTVLSGKPAVIGQIRVMDCYSDMRPQITLLNQNKHNTIEGVTCFVSHFRFECVQPEKKI